MAQRLSRRTPRTGVRTCVPVRSRGPGYIVLTDRYPSSVAISLSSSRNILSPLLNIHPVLPIPNSFGTANWFCRMYRREEKSSFEIFTNKINDVQGYFIAYLFAYSVIVVGCCNVTLSSNGTTICNGTKRPTLCTVPYTRYLYRHTPPSSN
jgi:hypothetical protein